MVLRSPAISVVQTARGLSTSTMGGGKPAEEAPEKARLPAFTVARIEVSDGTHTATDVVTVLVNADNDAPTLDAGPDQVVIEESTVVLAAMALLGLPACVWRRRRR